MTAPISDIAFTPTVKAVQEKMGSRSGYAKMEARGGWSDVATPELAEFIAQRDSFYLGTASADGRPYIQHRGGVPGFLKIVGDRRLAFADYRGNRQYISVGNLDENDQAFIFLMDYPNRRRIKIWGRAHIIDDDKDDTFQRVANEAEVPLERVVVFDIEAWDVNCPQHITPRLSADEQAEVVRALRQRIGHLEAQVDELRAPVVA